MLQTNRAKNAHAVISEAVSLRRALSSKHPDAFESWLSTSLAVQANCLDAMERTSDATKSNADAIRVLRRGFLKHPASFIHWMKTDVPAIYPALRGTG